MLNNARDFGSRDSNEFLRRWHCQIELCTLLLGQHECEGEKLMPLCATSCPTRMLKGVREGQSEGECVHEGDHEGDGVPIGVRLT